jgi:glycosyltransferase involved in cell wall biosynthesis
MSHPKISIITPSFNQGKFIEKTILSVLNQHYPNTEYIIIDGGSTDETVDIIKSYADKITYWVSEKDNGQSHALNKGLTKCTGDIIAYINSDDYYNPEAFGKVVDFFRQNPHANAVCGYCTRIFYPSEEEVEIFTDKVGDITFKRMLRYWNPAFCPPQPSVFFTRRIFEKVGYFDEALHYTMDLDYWLRISQTEKIHTLKKNLSSYLIHADSKGGSTGGFAKFVPEYRMLSLKYKKYLSLLDQVKYYYSYYSYPIKMAIKNSSLLK